MTALMHEVATGTYRLPEVIPPIFERHHDLRKLHDALSTGEHRAASDGAPPLPYPIHAPCSCVALARAFGQ